MDLDFAWLHPEFSAAGAVLGVGLLAYLVLAEPLLGVRTAAYLRRHQGVERSHALRRVYVLTLGVESAWVGVVALILLLSPGLEPGALGLALPSGSLAGTAIGFTAVGVLTQIVTGIVVWVRRIPVPVAGNVGDLLPVTPADRRLAAGVAVAAGVGEEVLVRGLLIALGVGFFGLPPLVAAIATTVLFGLIHLYQGWAGVLLTTMLGAIFAGLYLTTGSLLLPVLFHIAVDLRGLLLTRPPTATMSESSAA